MNDQFYSLQKLLKQMPEITPSLYEAIKVSRSITYPPDVLAQAKKTVAQLESALPHVLAQTTELAEQLEPISPHMLGQAKKLAEHFAQITNPDKAIAEALSQLPPNSSKLLSETISELRKEIAHNSGSSLSQGRADTMNTTSSTVHMPDAPASSENISLEDSCSTSKIKEIRIPDELSFSTGKTKIRVSTSTFLNTIRLFIAIMSFVISINSQMQEEQVQPPQQICQPTDSYCLIPKEYLLNILHVLQDIDSILRHPDLHFEDVEQYPDSDQSTTDNTNE